MLPYRRYRAPQANGESFFDPPWSAAPQAVAANVRRRNSWNAQLHGRDLAELSAQGRRELLRLATDYTRQYLDLPAADSYHAINSPLLMAGHQPQLFHVGVWYKNFMLDRLADKVGGWAVNWIVDNDLCGPAAIRVPTGSVSEPRVENVAFDRGTAEIPFEERALLDPHEFASFGPRVRNLLQPLIDHPLVERWWPRAIEAVSQQRRLGHGIAQARHQQEAQWGSKTLELPLSQSCETPTFRTFLLHFLVDLPRLQGIYNQSLLEYRRLNHVRSRSHPVPQLEYSDGWWEAPLWVWTVDQPQRKRLFVRRAGEEFQLTDRDSRRWELPVEHDRAQVRLAELAKKGVKLRPRALVTTIYARIVLCDLFLHGIGGGKYDQLSDLIVQRWLGIEPPTFQVATATARLPIPRPEVTDEDLRRVEQQLREMTFNPDRLLNADGPARRWIEEKRRWLTTEMGSGAGRERHLALQQANAALQPFLDDRRQKTQWQRDQLVEALRRERLLGSREFSFCLFPEETLRALLLDNA